MRDENPLGPPNRPVYSTYTSVLWAGDAGGWGRVQPRGHSDQSKTKQAVTTNKIRGHCPHQFSCWWGKLSVGKLKIIRLTYPDRWKWSLWRKTTSALQDWTLSEGPRWTEMGIYRSFVIDFLKYEIQKLLKVSSFSHLIYFLITFIFKNLAAQKYFCLLQMQIGNYVSTPHKGTVALMSYQTMLI